MCATGHTCRSEDNLWLSVLSFHLVGPTDQTQEVMLGGLYSLSHLDRSVVFKAGSLAQAGLQPPT